VGLAAASFFDLDFLPIFALSSRGRLVFS